MEQEELDSSYNVFDHLDDLIEQENENETKEMIPSKQNQHKEMEFFWTIDKTQFNFPDGSNACTSISLFALYKYAKKKKKKKFLK